MIQKNIFVNLSELIEMIEVNSVDKYYRKCSTKDQIMYLVAGGVVKAYEAKMAPIKTDPTEPSTDCGGK